MNSAGRISISSIFQHGLQDGYLSLNIHVKGGLFPLMAPSATFRFNCWTTSSRQWTGTFGDRFVTVGSAVGSARMCIGGPGMVGSSWCGHVLNTNEAYRSSNHVFIWSALFGDGRKGRLVGRLGGAARFGHPHAANSI